MHTRIHMYIYIHIYIYIYIYINIYIYSTCLYVHTYPGDHYITAKHHGNGHICLLFHDSLGNCQGFRIPKDQAFQTVPPGGKCGVSAAGSTEAAKTGALAQRGPQCCPIDGSTTKGVLKVSMFGEAYFHQADGHVCRNYIIQYVYI